MIQNRNMPSVAVPDSDGGITDILGNEWSGLTKLEYAAIHIFCSGESPKSAVVLANALFDALEAQGDSDD